MNEKVRLFFLSLNCHFPDIVQSPAEPYNRSMKRELENVLHQLKKQGISDEMRRDIVRNADAGILEYVKFLLYRNGEEKDERVGRVPQ